jgi:hypothetical protein
VSTPENQRPSNPISFFRFKDPLQWLIIAVYAMVGCFMLGVPGVESKGIGVIVAMIMLVGLVYIDYRIYLKRARAIAENK